ncbi:hypothetical protein HPB49_005181 [Dermacentor silvarum]|uniref:Uncharacterized protein n=1 Tax=Dermacentor silvarum TaxID=543639 RepID=A0ACB8DVK9_DERSI|nr:hypothetical protein HPB49_005181 [Dermacentor silvarum]
MAASLESILSRLLVPDNAVIVQATQELKEAYKDPNIVQHLCHALCMSENVQVRQYSAVLLRKKLYRLRSWRKLSLETQNGLKSGLLQRITTEREKAVVLAVCQLVAVIAKHECQRRPWTELQQLLSALMHSKNIDECTLGFHMASVISSVAPEVFSNHFKPLFKLFGDCLQSCGDDQICFYVIKSMTALVSSIGTDDANCFQVLIPYVMEVIRRLASSSEDKAVEALELFDELIDSEIAILLPHIRPLIKLCLEKDALAATNRSQKAFRGKKCKYPELEGKLVKYVIDTRNDGYAVSTDMVRVKALNIARHMEIPKAQFKASRGWATRFMNRNQLSIRRRTELGHLTDRVKDRLATTRTDLAVIPGGLTSVLQPLDAIVKHKLIPELLDVLFPIMEEVSAGELDRVEDEEEDEQSCQSPSACAAQLIDTMALHLPPEKLLPPLFQHVDKYVKSDKASQRRAAYLAIAVIAEGCSEAIRQKHLPAFVQAICEGVLDNDVHVRNAALFALGQFADFLQKHRASASAPITSEDVGRGSSLLSSLCPLSLVFGTMSAMLSSKGKYSEREKQRDNFNLHDESTRAYDWLSEQALQAGQYHFLQGGCRRLARYDAVKVVRAGG